MRKTSSEKKALITIVAWSLFVSSAFAQTNPFSSPTSIAGIPSEIPPALKQKMTKGDDYGNITIYVFVSSSMPIETIRNYIKQTEPIKRQTVFLLRGFVGGVKKFRPTWNYVMEILCGTSNPSELESSDCLEAFIDINPILFDEFGIDTVPAVMVRESGAAGECGVEGTGTWYRSSGDAPLLYHLEKMAKKGSRQAELLQKGMKDVYWDR